MNTQKQFTEPAVIGRRRDRWFGLGLFSGLAPMAAPGGIFGTAAAKGIVVCLALSATGGAWYGGRQIKAREDARQRVAQQIRRSWRFAEAKDAELLNSARISALSAMNIEASHFRAEAGNPAAGSDSLAMALRANRGKLSDPEAARDEKKDDSDAKEEADGNEDPMGLGNLLPDISEMTKNAKEGKLPDLGIGKLRDSLSGAGGAGKAFSGLGMSGGIRRKFAGNGGLRNKTLLKAKLKQDALSRIADAEKTFKRNKSAARGRGLSLSGDNFKRLAKMNRAMAPTKKSDDLAGSARTHTDQWSSAQALGGAGVGGAGSGAIGVTEGAAETGGAGAGSGSASSGGSANPNADLLNTDPVKNGKNKTPNQNLILAAMAAIITSVVLLVTAAALIALDSFTGVAKGLAYAAAVLAAIVILIGIALAATGQIFQGAMFGVVGAVLVLLALMTASNAAAGGGAPNAVTQAAEHAGNEAADVISNAQAAAPITPG